MPPDDTDIPELTAEFFARARPAREVFSEKAIADFKAKGGRPVATNPKVQVSIRLDKDLLDKLKADHPDWRQMVNDTMRSKVFKKSRAA